MSIKLNLKGFDELLDKVNKANGDVDKAAAKAIKDSARIAQTELETAAKSAGVPNDIVRDIRVKTTAKSNVYSAKVGWELGRYDPRKLSSGFKALFINYGTVRRTTKAGQNRGAMAKPPKQKQFITVAKRRANTKIKKSQQQIIEKIARDIK